MAGVVVTNVPVVALPAAPTPHPGAKYAKIYRNLGIAEIVLGTLSILFGITAIALVSSNTNAISPLSYVSSGIWCGLLVLVAGVLGVASGRRPESCPITSAMILTIFAAIAAGIMFAIEVPAAVYAGSYFYTIYYSYPSYVYYQRSEMQDALTGIHATLSVIAFVQLVLSIIHSAYCCASNCCSSHPGQVMVPQRTVVTTATIPGQLPVTAIQGQPLHSGYNQTHYVVQGHRTVISQGVSQQPAQPNISTRTTDQPVYAQPHRVQYMNPEQPPQYQEKQPV